MSGNDIIQIITVTATAVICIATTGYLGRALLRWQEHRHRQPPADDVRVLAVLDELRERMASVERTVEASAVELERIGEADRYIAKLLVERMPTALPRPERAERVITPH